LIVKTKLIIRYENEKTAKTVFDSVHPDNIGYIIDRVKGKELIFETKGENPGTIRNTIDDLLADISSVEKILNLNNFQ